jgi:hypothetical protein
MIQLVLQQHIKVGSRYASPKPSVEIVGETTRIRAPRLSEHLDRSTSGVEAAHQLSVVAVASGARVE